MTATGLVGCGHDLRAGAGEFGATKYSRGTCGVTPEPLAVYVGMEQRSGTVAEQSE